MLRKIHRIRINYLFKAVFNDTATFPLIFQNYYLNTA